MSRRRNHKKVALAPTCQYCQQPAVMAGGLAIYPHRPDLAHKQFWRCEGCDAYVGCHPDGKPFGILANAELRRAKVAAHAAFDPIWREMMRTEGVRKGQARARAYGWLASRLGIEPRACHIGRFDIDRCTATIGACKQFGAAEFLPERSGKSPAGNETVTDPTTGSGLT